jgi:hypothetical protein
MTNHNTPQLSRMDLANHCAAFPRLSLLNIRAVILNYCVHIWNGGKQKTFLANDLNIACLAYRTETLQLAKGLIATSVQDVACWPEQSSPDSRRKNTEIIGLLSAWIFPIVAAQPLRLQLMPAALHWRDTVPQTSPNISMQLSYMSH